jgi:glucose-1-phosphate cytidylyltransferase
VTGVVPSGRFGSLEVDEDRVTSFAEKSESEDAWINGGLYGGPARRGIMA